MEPNQETAVPVQSVKFSDALGNLTQALALAQLGYTAIKKDKKNPYTNSMYADLQSVVAATQPSLAKNGLVVLQVPVVRATERLAGVISRLTHSSGEFVEVELLLPATMPRKKNEDGGDGPVKFDAQSIGGAITYARRYTYSPQVGAVAEDDDDGNAASGHSSQNENTPSSRPQPPKSPKMDTRPAPQGESRPNKVVNAPPAQQSAPETNDLAYSGDSGIPKAIIPSEAPAPNPGNAPDKSVFDGYIERSKKLIFELEKVGLKASKGLPAGQKFKRFLLTKTGALETSQISTTQWDDFFLFFESEVQNNPQKAVELIEGGTK